MAIGRGSRVGPYEVTALLGQGGMGKVWRARHAGLKRDDALKVLPDAVSADPARLARFEREAQILASLNHPNIAQVHGLERAEGLLAIVMELVEGPTLAERLAHGPLRIDEALSTATQIAKALEAAHGQGVIHRDLKPANIKIRPDGTAKVLDFGLARVAEPAGGPPADLSGLPTMTSPALTEAGMVLGTAAYMSPEQARGQPADARSDIWAFGCLVYEMLTGSPTFGGPAQADVLSAVLGSDPDWSRLPARLPPRIRTLVRRCLQKDAARRLHDIADARIELEDVEADAERPAASRPAPMARAGWLVAVVALLVAGLALFPVWSVEAPPPERRVEVTTPPATDLNSFAVSPDGLRLVFVAIADGRPHLWLRELGSTAARPLAGTANANRPCWSPDSQSVAFMAEARLRVVNIGGGLPRTLEPTTGGGCSWSRDGVIVYGQGPTLPLRRVLASGGSSVVVTQLDRPATAHAAPSFLPDGRHFLFHVSDAAGRSAFLGSLASLEASRLFDAEALSVRFLPPDLVTYVQAGNLFARPFDTATLQAGDTPYPLAQGVGPQVSVSSQGDVIAYRARPERQPARELTWFDRAGRNLGPIEEAASHPEVSPDARWVATWGRVPAGIWVLDTTRRAARRLNDIPGPSIWSPDGRRLVFNCGNQALCVQRADGSATMDRVWEARGGVLVVTALDWSRDGQHFLIKQYESEQRSWDLYALPVTAEGKVRGEPIAIAAGNADERDGQFSPDGRWIAYQSNDTGQVEIWLRSFPDPRVVERVTGSGGSQVRWGRDGELLYLAPNGDLMAATVVPSSAGDKMEVGNASRLFATGLMNYANSGAFRQDYDVSPDGQRVLMNAEVGERFTPPITLILDWKRPSPGGSGSR
jgi:Tol biopolymer transport system component